MSTFHYMTVVDTRADGMYVLRVYVYADADLALAALRMACRDGDAADVLAALDARGGAIYDPTAHSLSLSCFPLISRLGMESLAAGNMRPGSSLCVVRRGTDPGLVYLGPVPGGTFLSLGFFTRGLYALSPGDGPCDARQVRACPEILHLRLWAADMAAL